MIIFYPTNLIVYYFLMITQTKEKLSDTTNNTGLQRKAFNITKECLLLNKFIKYVCSGTVQGEGLGELQLPPPPHFCAVKNKNKIW